MIPETFVIDIKEASSSETYYKDNWYIVLPNHYYKKIFGHTIKKTGNLPWKRSVIKIYSPSTKKSIHRIYKGSFRVAATKGYDRLPVIRMSSEAAHVLVPGNVDKVQASLLLSKGSKFKFYWNHFDASIRCGYKLGFVALLVSVIGLVTSLMSLV